MQPLISVPPSTPNFFARACFAVAQAHCTKGRPEQFIPKNDNVTGLILRADATPASTTTAGYGLELAQDAMANFLVNLLPYSGASRLIQQAVKAKLRPVDQTTYPVRATAPIAPAFVLENGAIPVRSNDFDLLSIGPAKKMAHILVWSRELSRRSDAEAIFEQMLREDVAAGIDTAFFATTAGSASTPAGLLNGLTAIAGYAGGDRDSIEQDFVALSDAVASTGNVTYVVSPKRLERLKIRAPDIFGAIDIVSSAVVPDTRVIAVDGASLIVAVDPAPDILRSEEGLLHMSDVPLEIVSGTGPTTADPVRSLWQTASIAVRVIHEIEFVKRRTDAVAYVENPTW